MRPLAVLALCCVWVGAAAEPRPRPNILWITSEDNGPHLGCYGDAYADTPNLNRLAAKGLIYLNAWSTAPVCAPARTAIISGLYPSSTGSEHMRSMTRLPAGMQLFPQYLRDAGYYCSNNSKEDYNLHKPGKVWDASSAKAHWKYRGPGQPFFAVFNHTVTHESQIRKRPHRGQHDPAKVRVPAYHPDTPEVRRDWAQYYDQITAMDELAGRNLRELEEAGLAESTIVFYFGDHGPGMPRCKRWPYNSGLQVPLIVFVPEMFKHLAPKDYVAGGKSERLIGFVDLAPTVLSLAGIRPPDFLQGRAFMGPFAAPPATYLHGLRGRMDERYDLVRSVRDARYVYIRNYMPHEIYGQHIAYMFETPTTRVWKELFDQGKLVPPQTLFWQPKPSEELYDLQQDPDEVHNLASSPAHQPALARLGQAQRDQVFRIRDVGFLPEGEIHDRSKGSSPYEAGHDPKRYPLERVFAAAELASSGKMEVVASLQQLLEDPDSAVRHWAALGLLMRGRLAVTASADPLKAALTNQSPYVRTTAAEALARYGPAEALASAEAALLECASIEKHGVFPALWALNGLEALGPPSSAVKDKLTQLPSAIPGLDARVKEYVPRALERLTGRRPPQ